MGYKIDRTSESYSQQLTTRDVKTTPMKSGIASGGPMDKVKLEAPLTWDGKIVRWKYVGDGSRRSSGYHPGRYVWNEKAIQWKWVKDVAESVNN